jgi:hypothetical protein
MLRNATATAAELENLNSKVLSVIGSSLDKYDHIAIRGTFCCTRTSVSCVFLKVDGSTFETGDLIQNIVVQINIVNEFVVSKLQNFPSASLNTKH